MTPVQVALSVVNIHVCQWFVTGLYAFGQSSALWNFIHSTNLKFSSRFLGELGVLSRRGTSHYLTWKAVRIMDAAALLAVGMLDILGAATWF